MISQDTLIYLALSSSIIFLGVSNTSIYGPYAIVAYILIIGTAGILGLLAFADYILFTTITSVFGITFQPAKNYKINKHQDAVIKYVNGIYYATGYMTSNLFEYVFKAEMIQEGEEERQADAPDIWERAVMSIPFPFKYNVVSCARDIQKVRDELEGQRSYQEFQLARAYESKSTNETIVADIQRTMSVIQAKIDRISQEELPVSTLMYIETTAVGVSEAASLDALSAQVKQLQLAFGGFDTQIFRIVGRELYHLFLYNFSLPTTFEEIAAVFDVEQ